MSTQHTPGLLKVAVEIFDNDGQPETAIQALNGATTVAVALEFGPNNPRMRADNARRIAACWNACEGLSTESLERSDMLSSMNQRRRQLENQRDQLLEALKEAREALQFANDSPGGAISDTIWMMHRPETLFDFMDAAIAKATHQ